MVLSTRRQFVQTLSAAAISQAFAPKLFAGGSRIPLAFSTLGCPAWDWKRILDFAHHNGFAAIELRGLQANMDLPANPIFASDRIQQTTTEIQSAKLRIACVSSSATLYVEDSNKRAKELADARAKVNELVKQIAEANKPPLLPEIATNSVSDQNWSTGNARIDGLIRFYGKQNGIDPFLIYCLMSQESKLTSGAVSPKGAMGLMQLMPGTAARYGVSNPYDVAQNIAGGTRYLKYLLKMFNGRVDLALAGYNAGEGAVMKYGNTIPPYNETQNYVKLIIKRYGKKPVS